MRRSLLIGWFLLAAVAVPEAHAQQGTVTIGSGNVVVTASADARCSNPEGGAVERPADGDSTLPYEASVTADVSVPCTPENHTARGDASAGGNVTTGFNGTVITASGTASAGGNEPQEASGFAEFNQEFSVNDAPVDYRLSVSGNVMFNGGLVQDQTGTLQPGGYSIRGFVDCSASATANCDPRTFSLTLELGIPEDSDGDGLFDVWETEGTPGLDLPAMGANPRHKDIFLEIDHMTGHALSQTAVDRVVEAFKNAPVANPDGRSGITLHVDNGPASRMDPTTGAAWGTMSDADVLPHQTVLGTQVGNDYQWSAFDALKAANFRPERADAFHYLISAHRHGSATNSSSGIARDFGASDLIVSLGSIFEPQESSGTVAQQAGTIMHELGHNLGLRHGGDDDGNYEPNRLSIMNYAFQFTGIPRADGTDVLDYSRLAVNLDERALNENIGFGLAAGTEPAEWLTIYRCPNRSQRWAFLQASQTDWNCDGTTAGVVARDLNGDARRTRLVPFLDWPALVYDGGAIGGAGAPLPDETAMIEPPVEELLASAEEVRRAHVEAAAGPSKPRPRPPAPGGGEAALAISDLELTPSAFPAARRGGSTGRRGKARLRFRASAAGRVRFTVRRCVVRKRRCARLARVRGSFTLAATRGVNKARFTGRLRRRALRPGRYQLVASPMTALQRPAAAQRVRFRIVRRR